MTNFGCRTNPESRMTKGAFARACRSAGLRSGAFPAARIKPKVPFFGWDSEFLFRVRRTLDGQNVAFVLRVLGTPRREITPRVFDALRAVGLSSRAQAYPAQLSQGEAQ